RPKVIAVAVPPPVAAIDSVWPARPSPTADRPSLASAVPESVRPALPAEMLIAPAVTDEEPAVAALMAGGKGATVSPIPMLVPVLVEPVVKEKVVPLTTSVSAVVRPVARSLDDVVPVPDKSVVLVIAAAVPVLSLFTTEPVTGPDWELRRLLAVAPVSTAELMFDLVE